MRASDILAWLEAAATQRLCPTTCNEGHTYRYPCAMRAAALRRR